MGFYTGCTGSLYYRGLNDTISKPVAKVRDWSVEISLDMLETTTLENCTKTYIPSTKNVTGSATLMYYRLETDELSTYAQFTALLGKIQKVGAVTAADRVELRLRTGPLDTDDMILNAYITNAQISMSPNELVMVPIQFQVDGDFRFGGMIS